MVHSAAELTGRTDDRKPAMPLLAQVDFLVVATRVLAVDTGYLCEYLLLRIFRVLNCEFWLNLTKMIVFSVKLDRIRKLVILS